eukprot:UN23696
MIEAIENVSVSTNVERKEHYAKGEFVKFFERSTLLVERCLGLNASYDLFANFSEQTNTSGEQTKSIDIKKRRQYLLDETKDRPIISHCWSKLNSDLFLATYAPPPDSTMDQPDGLVVIWNVLLDNRPEYTFTCQSMVTVAQFHPSNPKQIIGCTLSGQVLLWDMKERKRTPTFRSKFLTGHTQAIFAMCFLPNKALQVEQILTVSHDAKIYVWRDDSLSDPHKMEFKVEGENRGSDEFTTSCFSFPVRDHNTITLGSDTGRLYTGLVYSDVNPQPVQELKAHAGPVTNIEYHPEIRVKNLNADILQLFLTSSYDWTVKLWDKKTGDELLCFDYMNDYVHDVRWSPVHPAVFACVDGQGHCCIFNLNNKDHGQPVLDKQITKSEVENEDGCGVCRLAWSSDGKQILFGDAVGNMHVFEVTSEELYSCTEDDVSEFQSK